MAAVFEATHVASGEDVAIKLMHRKLSDRDRDAFAREVRAIARLDHPGIIGILDAGELDRPLKVGQREFDIGAPYLVMELANGGVFGARGGIQSWADARRVLIQVLDSLAHAHALGIVHRDIKPGNLLVQDGRCVLSDFGIVRLGEGSNLEETNRIVGTPAFMAPEQIRAQVLAQGPWTDLYSVGVLAWDMVTASRPYEGNHREMLRAHLHDPLPELTPRFAIPKGLEKWLHTMLAKTPRSRFQRASDAAYALHALGAPTLEGTNVAAPDEDLPTETLVFENDTISTDDWQRLEFESVAGVDTLPAMVLPSVPEIWQRPGKRGQRRLANAGLGLFGLRSIPLVDRESERSAIWRELIEAARHNEPRCVVLSGPSGLGKSRLAEWVARRAHELGCAEVLHAALSEQDSPSSGLARLLSRFFGTRKLEGAAVRERIDECLEHHRFSSELDAETFADIAARSVPKSSQPLIIENNLDVQQFAAVARLITHLSMARPVVVWIDDAIPGGDLARFVATALRGAVRGPALFVLTERGGADSQRLLHELEDAKNLTRIEVGPLTPTYVRSLAATTMGLEPTLSDLVAANSSGSPLNAIQMIADWVERNDLVVGPGGYQLRVGSIERTGSHTIADVWVARLQNAFRTCGFAPDRGEHAMKLAALLGRRLSYARWSVATAFPEPELRALGRALFSAGLATPTQDGVLLAFETLRQAILAAQTESETRRRHHLACAYALEHVHEPGEDEAIRLQRVSYHLEEAGNLHDSLQHLLDALELFARRFETVRATELATSADRLIDALGLPEHSEEVIRLGLERANMLALQKAYEEARSLATSCLEKARHARLRELEARALVTISNTMFNASVSSVNDRRDEAIELGERATELYLAIGDEEGASRALLTCSYAHLQCGRTDEAAESTRRAIQMTTENPLGLALAHYLLGTVERARGNDDEALFQYDEAIDISLASGVRLLLAGAYNGRGDILRFRGDVAEAIRSYQDAILLWENLGSPNVSVGRINAALAHITVEDYASARAELAPVLATRGKDPGYEVVFAETFMLPCLAAAGESEAYDEQWASATESLERLGIADRDIITTFEHVSRLWRARGDEARARAAEAAAAGQRAKLGG